MIKRYGEPVRVGRKYKYRPGAYAILTRGDNVLLTFQADPFYEFQLPGGGIDPHENPIPALHREVMEETGWRISIRRHIETYRRFVFMPEYGIWAEKVCHIYHGHPTLRISDPTEAGHTDLWAPAASAVAMLKNPADAEMLQKYLG